MLSIRLASPCQVYHRAAVLASRDFWRLLRKDHINLVYLTAAFRRIDHMEVMADKTYRTVLERYVCWIRSHQMAGPHHRGR